MAVTISVLGSGGPIVNARRASSGYLLAVDGVARVLIDAGGGTFERLGRLGANLSSLEMVLLTHTHIDHTGGLAPVVFDLALTGRTRPLAVAGPSGRDMHPGCVRFTELLFARDGAWSYLHTFDGFGIAARELRSEPERAAAQDVPLDGTALAGLGVRVRAVAVRHGMMPALAYRIDCAGSSVVLSGDVSEASAALIELARGCDLLVHDMALPERDVPHGELHAKPSAVGRVARQAEVRALLTTHFMPPIENELDDALEIVRREYPGTVLQARDLMVLTVGDGAREAEPTAAS